MVLPVLPHQRRRCLAEQADGPRSPFYEVNLEQRWQHVDGGSKLVVASEKVFIVGEVEAKLDAEGSSRQQGDAYVWFMARVCVVSEDPSVHERVEEDALLGGGHMWAEAGPRSSLWRL